MLCEQPHSSSQSCTPASAFQHNAGHNFVVLNVILSFSTEAMFKRAKWMLTSDNGTELANWTIPMHPMETNMPFLLGHTSCLFRQLHPLPPLTDSAGCYTLASTLNMTSFASPGMRQNSCFGSTLKIYVYNTSHYSVGSVFCSAGQWGVEVMIHRYFASSACRVDNPQEADIFLVPDYRACHFHLAPTYQHKGLTRLPGDDYHSQVIRNHALKYHKWDEADNLF